MILLQTLQTIILIIWQLPQNLLGTIVWLVCQIKKRQSKVYNGRVLTEWGLYSGISLGYFIFVHETASDNTKMHEYGHTKQSQYLGWLYLLVIGLPSIIWAGCFDKYRAKNGVSYYSLYCENWADKLGGVDREVKTVAVYE